VGLVWAVSAPRSMRAWRFSRQLTEARVRKPKLPELTQPRHLVAIMILTEPHGCSRVVQIWEVSASTAHKKTEALGGASVRADCN